MLANNYYRSKVNNCLGSGCCVVELTNTVLHHRTPLLVDFHVYFIDILLGLIL